MAVEAVAITAGAGTDIAVDSINVDGGDKKFQLIKISLGADGAHDLILDSGQQLMAASLPVVLSSDHSDVKITLDGEAVELGATALAALETITVAAVTAAIPAGDNNIGNVDIVSLPVETATTMNASSSDGATALTSTAQAIKAAAGVLAGYYIYNPNSSAVFVQFYNTAQGSVTVGTTTPLFMLTIPALSAANLWMGRNGPAFSTAMSWAATSTAGGNGAPAVALDAVAWYR